MNEKWQNLLARVELIESGEGQEIPSEEELLEFESQTSSILPFEYKEFCKLFGTGIFGDNLRIYCPPDIEMSQISIGVMLDEIESFPNLKHSKVMPITDIKNLLDYSLVFADTPCSDAILWDLRTYSDLDKSYDIYWTNDDGFDGDIYQVGRDFFEFVEKFALDINSYKVLPKSMRPRRKWVRPTFTRFKPNRNEFGSGELPTDPEEFVKEIAPMVKSVFESGMTAETISKSWGIDLELVRKAIDS
jgi:SMI1-KNR4 cell-wall